MIEAGLKHEYDNVRNWMSDHPEEYEIIAAPANVFTRYEPLGVVAVIGSWNAPIVTTLKPLMQAITAGNCAIVKPSEMAPHSSAAMKKLIDEYLDSDCYVCIEGGVDIAVAVNNLPLDLICFTGSTTVGRIIA